MIWKKKWKNQLIFDIENWLWNFLITWFRTYVEFPKNFFLKKCSFPLNHAIILSRSCWKNLKCYLHMGSVFHYGDWLSLEFLRRNLRNILWYQNVCFVQLVTKNEIRIPNFFAYFLRATIWREKKEPDWITLMGKKCGSKKIVYGLSTNNLSTDYWIKTILDFKEPIES